MGRLGVKRDAPGRRAADDGGPSRRIPGPLRAHGVRAAALAGLFLLCLLFLALGRLYGESCRPLFRVENVWYGADLLRHIRWGEEEHTLARARLHPLSFLIYRGSGLLLRGAGVTLPAEPGAMHALPSLLAASLFLVWAARHLATQNRGVARWAAPVALASIGPLLVFGPVPESHLLGGCALGFQMFWSHALARARERGDGPGAGRAARRLAVAAGAAIGFTLGNLLPALALLLALPSADRRRAWRPAFLVTCATLLFWLAGACVRAGAAGLADGPPERTVTARTAMERTAPERTAMERTAMERTAPDRPASSALDLAGEAGTPPAWRFLLASDTAYVGWPTPARLSKSARELCVMQFGVPWSRLQPFELWLDGRRVSRLYPRNEAPLASWVAAALLGGALVWWYARRRADDPALGRLLPAAGVALALVVLLHGVYGTREAYLFSPHAWPLLAVPASLLLAATIGARRRALAALAGLSVLLAGIQAVRGVAALLDLLPAM